MLRDKALHLPFATLPHWEYHHRLFRRYRSGNFSHAQEAQAKSFFRLFQYQSVLRSSSYLFSAAVTMASARFLNSSVITGIIRSFVKTVFLFFVITIVA